MNGIKKVITAVCAAIVLAVQTAIPVCAEATDVASVLSDIFSEVSQGGFYEGQEYGGADRIVYCYTELYGSNGADEYIASAKAEAEELVSSERFIKPTDLQKCAIALAHYGECTQELINAAVYLNDDFDKQGLNAYIWGLIAAGSVDLSPPADAVNTVEALTEYLLSKQLSDGGFALKGEAADCDITAAAITALSFSSDERAMEAADMAFETVKSMQLESGGFASMGTENCESTAQAIIAAACMGDAEWITDSGVLEALLDYRCESGFSHIYGGEANGLATSQACCALTAYLKLTADEEHAFSDTEEISEDTHETLEAAQGGITGGMLKLYIVALCAVSGLALLIIWLVGGRKKPLLCLAAVVFLVVGGVAAFVDFKSPEEYYSQGGVSEGIEVTVSVDCLEALGYPEKACDGLVIPRDGVIITERTVIVPEASTVMEALIEAAKADKITVDFVDSWSGVYIRGIAGLYEFDFGSESGWLYYVNGESPSCAASEYILQDGDRIRVCYTCTLGR